MKTLKVKSILFSLLAMMAVAIFMTSCEQESVVIEELEGLLISEQENNNTATESSLDRKFEMWLAMAEEANVIVEYATLEEINSLMVEHGLEPFIESDVNQTIQLKSNYPCSAYAFFGDYNQDGAVTPMDWISAYQYLCNSAAGCHNHLITQGYGHPAEVQKFGFLSYLLYDSEASVLNYRDIDIFQQFLRFNIPCYY